VVGIGYEGKQLVEDGKEQKKDFPKCYSEQAKPLKDLQLWEKRDNSGISKGVEGIIKPNKVTTFKF
jgi:hypothetical protein